MKRILLATILYFTVSTGLSAQSIGETWLLNKIEVTETTANGTTHHEISKADQAALLNFMGPKEIIFLSDSKLSYKRMENDSFETFSYTKSGKTLQIELSECLLKLDVETKGSEMLLSENKNIDENHTVKITYSYTK